VVVLLALLFASPTTALRPATTINPCILYSDSPKHLAQFAEDVWSPDRWRRGDPPAKMIQAWRAKQHCLPPGWQRVLRKRWRELQAAFFDRRRAELWRQRVTPFFGCTKLGICGWWAIPATYVSCESGGDYYPDAGLIYGGAYGLIPPTWAAYGGAAFAPTAYEASPREQDLTAHKVWLDVEDAAWAPFEPPGCG